MARMDVEQPSNPALQRLRVVLLCYLLPFFYGAATRVPLVYIGVEARQNYGMPWWQVGLLIATYQGARALANSAIPLMGTVVGHALLATAGLVGYILHGVLEGSLGWFWASTTMIGLSEVIICMQSYVKIEVTPFGTASLREHLRLQYAANVGGTAVGFIGAAALYQYMGVSGPAYLGIALEAGELLALAAYLCLAQAAPQSELTEAFIRSAPVLGFGPQRWRAPASPSPGPAQPAASARQMLAGKTMVAGLNSPGQVSAEVALPEGEEEALEVMASLAGMRVEPSVAAAFTRRSLAAAAEAGPDAASADAEAIEASAPRPPWISYLVVATFAVQALMIGVILSTVPILLFEQAGVNFTVVGVVFGAGEVMGCLLLFLLVPAAHQKLVRKHFRGPLNLLVVVAVLGAFSILFVINHLAAFICATLVIMTLNDFGTSLAAEFQGGSIHPYHYMRINSLANTMRRVGNTTTAALGPLMYGVIFWLPFVVFGACTLAWVGFMCVAFTVRANQVIDARRQLEQEQQGQQSAAAAAGGGHRGLMYYLKDQTFITSELAMWQVSAKPASAAKLHAGTERTDAVKEM